MSKKLRPEDEAALDSFCESLAWEDLSFGDWQRSTRSLDLIIEVPLSGAEASKNGKRFLDYTCKKNAKKVKKNAKFFGLQESKTGKKFVLQVGETRVLKSKAICGLCLG